MAGVKVEHVNIGGENVVKSSDFLLAGVHNFIVAAEFCGEHIVEKILRSSGAFVVEGENPGKALGFAGFVLREGVFAAVDGDGGGGGSCDIGVHSVNEALKLGVGAGGKVAHNRLGGSSAEKVGKHGAVNNIAVALEHKGNTVASEPVIVEVEPGGNVRRGVDSGGKVPEKSLAEPSGEVLATVNDVDCGLFVIDLVHKIVGGKLYGDRVAGRLGIGVRKGGEEGRKLFGIMIDNKFVFVYNVGLAAVKIVVLIAAARECKKHRQGNADCEKALYSHLRFFSPFMILCLFFAEIFEISALSKKCLTANYNNDKIHSAPSVLKKFSKFRRRYADVAELADALDSGSSVSNDLWVQVPSSAPKRSSQKAASFFI